MANRGKRIEIAKRGGSDGGMSYQLPKGWDDGSGKIRHVQSGPNKGRVIWSSRHEAQEIAKRLEGQEGGRVRYDPD